MTAARIGPNVKQIYKASVLGDESQVITTDFWYIPVTWSKTPVSLQASVSQQFL